MEIASLLLNRGAHPFPALPDNFRSPLAWAAARGHEDLVQLLESKRGNSAPNEETSAIDKFDL
ncbi:hypothetical protein BDZ91DRAFT_750166, partial [Kalaharituber pfeilii]